MKQAKQQEHVLPVCYWSALFDKVPNSGTQVVVSIRKALYGMIIPLPCLALDSSIVLGSHDGALLCKNNKL